MGIEARRRTFTTAVVATVATVATTWLGACAGETSAPPAREVSETVVIGRLPGALSGTTLLPPPPTTTRASTTTSVAPRGPITGPLVDEVRRHRLLLVGDTALSATTPRADGIMCDLVTDFGWDVEIEAERGRPISFAEEVLDELLDDRPGWDAVGLMFGHHVPTTVDDFERTLDEVLDRVGDRPVVLYTVAETGDEQEEVNELLRARADERPNVVLIDWAEFASEEPDVLLDDGGPFPTEEGAGRLALFTVAVLGEVPDGEPGECLDAVFTDDSAIVL